MSDGFCLTLWHLLQLTLVVIHETLGILEFKSLGTVIKLRGQETSQSLLLKAGDRILFSLGSARQSCYF